MNAPGTIRLSSVLSALSYALDLTEGHPSGHTARTCLIGMRLTRVLGLSVAERSTLFYALLLKDAGCSSNAFLVSRLFGGDDQAVKHQAEPTSSSVAYGSHRLPRAGPPAFLTLPTCAFPPELD